MNRIIKIAALFLLICTTITYSQTINSLRKLERNLNLSKGQTVKVAEVLRIQKKQAKRDRKLYKDEPIALIEAAKRRRATTLEGISRILHPDQSRRLRKIERMSPSERELFQIKEGLVLNREQTKHVGKIIRYYNNLIRVKMEEMREIREEFRHYAEGNPGRMANRGKNRIRKYTSKRFRELNKRKQKDIKTHLTKKQKKQYKKIVKMQKEMFKQRSQIRKVNRVR